MEVSTRQMMKERKLLEKYSAESKRGVYAGYVVVLAVMVSIIHILDAFSTDITNSLQTSVVTEFFVLGKGMDFQSGLALFSSMSLPLVLLNLLAPFYKALADKVGRKPILIMSVLGMGLGLLVCYLATNEYIFVLGKAIITFFIAADLQVVYILEVAPANKRGAFFSVTKFIGALGILTIPLLRGTYMANDAGNWRPVFLIPVMATLALIVLALFLLRESQVFLDSRIQALSTPGEKRAKEKKKGASGLGAAFRYCFQQKQTKALMLGIFLFALSNQAVMGYYESIMSSSGMDTSQVTTALAAYPFTYALVTLLSGFVSDKLGRKNLCIIVAGITLASLIAFIFSAKAGISPLVIGMIYGVLYGSYWAYSDYQRMIFCESVPTRIRSSVMAIVGLISLVGGTLSGALLIGAMLAMDLGLACVVFGAVFLGASLLVLLFKIKETKGVELSELDEAAAPQSLS